MKSNNSMAAGYSIGAGLGMLFILFLAIVISASPDSRCQTLAYVLPYKVFYTDGKCLVNIDADRWVPADQLKLIQK